ncbi:MAG: hypothetical protein H0U74_12570 [Bradymonadaceae bacterium]|nr:hypothetical protein [Lujinxingiaceae bacterium]
MSEEGASQIIRTSLVLGVQFDEFDFRLFLRDYHRELRTRFPNESFPAYSPSIVLDSLIFRHEPECKDYVAGGRHQALRQYCQRVHRMDLCLTGSDYGPREQRKSPYNYDRAFYHLGRELVTATLRMDYPGYNPYRSTRKLSIPFIRDNIDQLLELVPDYLWWAMHDQKDVLSNILAPEQLAEARNRIELAGFKLDTFGLYLTTLEVVHFPDNP